MCVEREQEAAACCVMNCDDKINQCDAAGCVGRYGGGGEIHESADGEMLPGCLVVGVGRLVVGVGVGGGERWLNSQIWGGGKYGGFL